MQSFINTRNRRFSYLFIYLSFFWISFLISHDWHNKRYSQGPDYDEFVKAAISDNEIQFVETSNIDVATVLFPDIKDTNHFLGIVKSEPERYTPYGEYLIWW